MRSASLAAGLIVLAWALGAQTPPAPAPPAAKVDPSRVTPYHTSFKVVQVVKGVEQEVATVEDVVVLSGDQIVRIQSVSDASGTMVDSSAADRATLSPRFHRSDSGRRSMQLEFTPNKVTGKYADTGEPPYDINETVTEGIFDSNMLDVLIDALPLAEGYRSRLPVFLWEAGGEIAADVAVTGSEKMNGKDTWAVDVTMAGRTARYNVAKKEPRVLQISSSPAPGVELKFVVAPKP